MVLWSKRKTNSIEDACKVRWLTKNYVRNPRLRHGVNDFSFLLILFPQSDRITFPSHSGNKISW